jgi:hypothetical protein
MRLLCFLPLAFVAGSHGFALFVPYLFLCLAAFHLRREHRRARTARRVSASPVSADAPLVLALSAA